MNRKLISGAAVAALLAVGCGSSSDSSGEATKTVVTVVKEKVVERPAADPAASKPKPAPAETVGEITVPDVVGENHQYAQDTMQAAGLYSLDERDATGRDRMLLWDRNWVVVEQDPPAGTVVDENATITLSSKKKGE